MGIAIYPKNTATQTQPKPLCAAAACGEQRLVRWIGCRSSKGVYLKMLLCSTAEARPVQSTGRVSFRLPGSAESWRVSETYLLHLVVRVV